MTNSNNGTRVRSLQKTHLDSAQATDNNVNRTNAGIR
jgi:hypothetical protein